MPEKRELSTETDEIIAEWLIKSQIPQKRSQKREDYSILGGIVLRRKLEIFQPPT